MSETATAALDVLYGLLSQGLGLKDEQVEAAFERAKQGTYRLEEDVRANAEKAAKEVTEANQTMAEALRELRELVRVNEGAAKEAANQAATLAKVLLR